MSVQQIILNITMCAVFIFLLPLPVKAEIKTIDAESSYVMGDNDSKIDARRIAVQEAKRKALEMAGTYIESLTEVKEMSLSKDEITIYTAGVVETEIVSEEMRGTAKNPEILIKARCKIDTAVLIDRINNLRKNEELKEQLEASLKENESLKKERDNLVAKLSSEKDKSKVEDIRKDLDNVLSKEEANDDTRKVWGKFISGTDFFDLREDIKRMTEKELGEALITLKRAIKINPKNQIAHLLLGVIYYRKGNIEEAKKEIKTAMDIKPLNPFLHLRLGIMLMDAGRYTEALREFRVVQRSMPNEPRMLFYTGITYNGMGDCKETVFYLKEFLTVVKRNGRPPFTRMASEAAKTIERCEREVTREKAKRRHYKLR
ncbi:MAG: tetratricopeptide repeat protein [Nitrospirae bacterium]|nr:tetratricopeptide repeat protein [Nitrospirota bacterium]